MFAKSTKGQVYTGFILPKRLGSEKYIHIIGQTFQTYCQDLNRLPNPLHLSTKSGTF